MGMFDSIFKLYILYLIIIFLSNFTVAFKIYDLDCDEYISVDDFSRCLQMMVGDNLNEDAVRKIAEMSVQEADSDGDGKLCEEEFRQAMAGCDINKLLSITVS